MIDITHFGASSALPDNTEYVREAMLSVPRGDALRVPPGLFMVRGEQLRGRSGVNIQLDGFLKAIPAAAQGIMYRTLILESVEDININANGGGLIGEREAHSGGTPEDMQAHNLAVYESNRIVIAGVISKDARGDNFYWSGVTNSTIQGCRGSNAMRNNLSIISVDTCNVLDSIFEGAHGPDPMPMAGIDIEPDRPDQFIRNLTITRCRFSKNKGAGIYSAMGNTQLLSNILVSGNDYDQHYRDGSGPPVRGRNTPLANFLYASCRWMPGYDYWAFPREFSV